MRLDFKFWIRFTGFIGGGTTLAVGGAVVGHGVFTAKYVNSQRKSYYTEKFHLTPESLRMPYKNVTFATEDGINLNGWLLEPSTHGKASQKLVILMHPYNSHKSNLLAMAQGLWDHNYNVFLFDFRSWTEPRTDQTIGFLEQKDALAAINWATKNVPCEKGIVLMGASMGASVSAVVAPKIETVANLKAIILDCPFRSLEHICRFSIRRYGHLPDFLVEPAVTVCRNFNYLWYGWELSEVMPEENIKKLSKDVQLMVIHAENDAVCPLPHGKCIYNNSVAEKKSFWLVEQSDHCGCFFKDPKKYIKRVARFLDDCFDDDDRSEKFPEIKETIFEELENVIINPSHVSSPSSSSPSSSSSSPQINPISIDDANNGSVIETVKIAEEGGTMECSTTKQNNDGWLSYMPSVPSVSGITGYFSSDELVKETQDFFNQTKNEEYKKLKLQNEKLKKELKSLNNSNI